MKELISKLKELDLKNCKVELIGNWLWISGNTYQIKEQLKDLGFFYSHNKKSWFFNNSNHKRNRAFCNSIEEIKTKYPTEEIMI